MLDVKNALIEAVTEKPTDAIKTLEVKGPNNYGMYYVGWDIPGGLLPKEFTDSLYTSQAEAQSDCDRYNKR